MKRILAFTLLAWLIAQPAWSAPVCSNPQFNETEADPMTISYTPAAGSNRIVIGVVHLRSDVTVASAPTFNGVSMTSYGSANLTAYSPRVLTDVYWTIVTTGGAQTFSADFSAVPGAGADAGGTATISMMTCGDTDTTTPFRAAATTLANFNLNPHTMTVASATGDLLVDFLTCYNCGATALTQGGSQTVIHNDSNGVAFQTAISSAAGVASLAMTWSDGDTTNGWAHVAGSLVPAATRPRQAIIIQ